MNTVEIQKMIIKNFSILKETVYNVTFLTMRRDPLWTKKLSKIQ